ncbi:cation:proton antiporter domain-containing protein [Salinirussus salinus]|uniref:cation:proton antiporter domain-containing protein n=1 Tax=Salinirussus salinus TaxID=1198300 RepID=UPI0013591359|nr:cation:proton antiporter [Salinirussus salinus]
MAASELILLTAGIIALGVVAQVLASAFEVPSIIFYLAAGIALGPEGAALITPDSFGDALPAIVGLAVAVIVFEGAFHLRLDRIREAPAATVRLVTLGAAIALVGTAVAVRFALGTGWPLAFLIGALLVATGPTVITPILDVVPVRDRVAAALETEGIINDVSAAITAVVVFEVLNPAASSTGLLADFTSRLGTGVIVGLVVAGVVYYILRFIDLSPGDAPRNARLLVLAGALVAYAVANAQLSEAGVAAVATAGVVLGNADIPYEEEVTSFKGDITLLVLSFVFIALAALLDFDVLVDLGVPGLAVVVAVAVVIRPLLVFVSTVGGRFTTRERVFMSAVGPRGIIPASVATLFAVELRNEAAALREEAATVADPEAAELLAEAAALGSQADVLVGTVFLVILATVAFEGGLARYIAEYLDVIPMRVIIVGGGKTGRALADRLEDRGENVVIVENDEDVVEQRRNQGYKVEWGDGTDTEVLRSAGAENAKVVVAATGNDDANLLVAQLSNSSFDVEKVIAKVNNPDNVEAFEDLGVASIDAGMASAWAIDNQIERPALAQWMTGVGRTGDVQEVEVTNAEFGGKPVSEVGPMLPESCLIALISRDGETHVPNADFVVEVGDKLTLLGKRDPVREGMRMVDP